jgi:hypothetical protein
MRVVQVRKDECAREVIGIIEQRRKRHAPDRRKKHRGEDQHAGDAKYFIRGDIFHGEILREVHL